MDKNVHPVAAALIILVSIVTISCWLWFTGEAKNLGGPSELFVSPHGHLYIQIQNRLIEHDSSGAFVAIHDLRDFDIDTVIGGMAFFSNGDILVRRGQDTRSILDTVRAYMRMTNVDSLQPDTESTGLNRCNLYTKICSRFGQTRIDFKAAFSVFIDHTTDDVYVSDTSRHLVRKYDSDGRVAADPVGGFQFPNQLMLHEAELLVADTNHHRIKIVDPNSNQFGQEIRSADVVSQEAAAAGKRWPNHFVNVNDQWWVNIMSSDMDYGGIFAFDNEWNFLRQIVLPNGADPISLVVFNNEVLISDWYGDRVHRLSLAGEQLGDFRSAGLAALITDSMYKRSHFRLLAWLLVSVGAVLVVALAIKGTDWSRQTPTEPEKSASFGDRKLPLRLEPDPKNVRKIRANLLLARLLIIPLALGMPVIMLFVDLPFSMLQVILLGGALVVVFSLAEWMIRLNLGTSIQITDNRITIQDHTGREAEATQDSVYFSNSYVVADGAAVFFGQLNQPIYDREQVLRELERRLGDARKISEWAMQKKLVEMRHPQGLIAIGSVLIIFAFALYELLR